MQFRRVQVCSLFGSLEVKPCACHCTGQVTRRFMALHPKCPGGNPALSLHPCSLWSRCQHACFRRGGEKCLHCRIACRSAIHGALADDQRFPVRFAARLPPVAVQQLQGLSGARNVSNIARDAFCNRYGFGKPSFIHCRLSQPVEAAILPHREGNTRLHHRDVKWAKSQVEGPCSSPQAFVKALRF